MVSAILAVAGPKSQKLGSLGLCGLWGHLSRSIRYLPKAIVAIPQVEILYSLDVSTLDALGWERKVFRSLR